MLEEWKVWEVVCGGDLDSRSDSLIMLRNTRPTVVSSATRRSAVKVQAAAWTKASTTDALKAAGGKLVVEVSGQKVTR